MSGVGTGSRILHCATAALTLGVARVVVAATPSIPLFLATFLLFFALLLGLSWALQRCCDPALEDDQQIVVRQRRIFFSEFQAFLIAGVLALAIEWWLGVLDPVATGYYFSLCLAMGYFLSINLTLLRSRTWNRTSEAPPAGSFRTLTASQRTRRFLGSVVVIALFLLSLTLWRLSMALEGGDAGHAWALKRFIFDLLLLGSVVGGMLVLVIQTYADNKQLLIDNQLQVLRNIQAGDLSSVTKVISQDELGLLATQINRLVVYLRERESMHDLLKKVVSPSIMEKLLTTDIETLKRGEENEVAILFCDIRGFTHLAEISSPEEIILFLNSFFSELSEIVSRNNGIVNKFMGDAILAVFGLGDSKQAVADAVQSGWEIVARSREIRLPDGGHPQSGIGIHFGNVMAGTIGSDQRYEYTFLGDAVNTASRLQGLSRRLNYSLILSADAYRMLPEGHGYQLYDLGFHGVRGKTEPVHVFGGAKGVVTGDGSRGQLR